jgi:hypothetical protein
MHETPNKKKTENVHNRLHDNREKSVSARFRKPFSINCQGVQELDSFRQRIPAWATTVFLLNHAGIMEP